MSSGVDKESGRASGRTGRRVMARRPGSGKTPQQAPGAPSPGSGIDRQAKTPRLALPADLGRSLHPLVDAQLDRLASVAAAQVRGRALDMAADPSGPVIPALRKSRAADRTAVATPGHQRIVLAAFEAWLRPRSGLAERVLSRRAIRHCRSRFARWRLHRPGGRARNLRADRPCRRGRPARLRVRRRA